MAIWLRIVQQLSTNRPQFSSDAREMLWVSGFEGVWSSFFSRSVKFTTSKSYSFKRLQSWWNTPPKFNSEFTPEKWNGWKTNPFLLGPANFSRVMLNFGLGMIIWQTKIFMQSLHVHLKRFIPDFNMVVAGRSWRLFMYKRWGVLVTQICLEDR